MRTIFLVATLLLLSLLLLPSPARGEEQPLVLPHVPTKWLVLPPVDHRARRPFNPDAVYERYLLDVRSGVPHAGDVLRGERGVEVAWKALQADEEGRVKGPLAYAYTRVESPDRRVVLARLDRSSTLFVNGTPVVGDVYGSGFGGLPVVLEKGANDFFARGARGALKLTLEAVPAPVFAATWSRTLPDLVAGAPFDAPAGIFLVNATESEVRGVRVVIDGPDWLAGTLAEPPVAIAPLSLLQVRLRLRSSEGKAAPPESAKVASSVRVFDAKGTLLSTSQVPLHVRPKEKAVLRTFVSDIDGSVQKFGLRAPSATPPKKPPGLVLSLHGAGVNARGQANAYSGKPDLWIAAATNRRPFGFDWQDWGRLDAYEVLDEALRISGVDRRRVYLTGHSMGGHGTWHLAANDPDGFAAIAPSAGWISFDTYPRPRRKGTRTKMWQHADGPSLTLSLLENLAQLPTLIVHGTKDDNVPVGQARQMEQYLTRAGRKPLTHYQEGAGHWWNGKLAEGADCVDLPAIFDLFRRHELPALPDELKFTTWNPAVDATHHWVTVWQQIEYGKPSTVVGRWDPDEKKITLHTNNVACLRIDDRPAVPVQIDGADLTLTGKAPHWLYRGKISDIRGRKLNGSDGPWAVHRHEPRSIVKSPTRCGPLRQAFRRRFLGVYPSKGTPEENAAALAQARFDAQMWYYRGNGRMQLLSDKRFETVLAENEGKLHRNLILYGNADTNLAFALLNDGCPIRVRRKQIQVRGEAYVGADLAACFVYPSKQGTLIGVMGSTGPEGARLGPTLLTFVSGAGFPDYVLFGPGVLTDGDGGVLRAGWFDREWKLQRQKPK